VVRYDEGALVGYRFYAAHGQTPLFPFGHGLSYGNYSYEHPRVTTDGDRMVVSVDLTNVGDRPGTEVVQVYVDGGLRGFRKVRLAPGETAAVAVEL
jgi:beta-glucosidase